MSHTVQATMETPVKRTIYFKQFKVHCPKDDQATIPLFHNRWVATPDTFGSLQQTCSTRR